MRVLVAGIGNVFLGDDGFGVEVVRRLDSAALPEGVDVGDYGIRGVHLAYDLLDAPYDTLVMVDAVPLREAPGTLAVLDVTAATGGAGGSPADAHSMSPDVVLRALRGLGGRIDRVLVLGCQPAVVDERMELSPPVRAAIDGAVRMVLQLVRELAAEADSPAEEREGSSEWTRSTF